MAPRVAPVAAILLLARPLNAQNLGDRSVNWLLPDINVYMGLPCYSELVHKMDIYDNQFGLAEAVHTRTQPHDSALQARFSKIVQQACHWGFWAGDNPDGYIVDITRRNYSEPMTVNELVGYSGYPARDILPLAETSYMRVSDVQCRDDYLLLRLDTKHASLVDGYYVWEMRHEIIGGNDTVTVRHSKLARANPNAALLAYLGVFTTAVVKAQNDVSVVANVDGILDTVFDTTSQNVPHVAAWGCMAPMPLGGVEASACDYNCQAAAPRPGLSAFFSVVGVFSILFSWLPCF